MRLPTSYLYREGRSAGVLTMRVRFNPSLAPAWFGSLMELVGHITMLSVILTGAALIREREHGMIEHLLVMPVTAGEIMLSKVWSIGMAVLLGDSFFAVFYRTGPVAGAY